MLIRSSSVSGVPPDEMAITDRETHDTQEGITFVRDHIYVPPGLSRVAVLQLCQDSTQKGHLG